MRIRRAFALITPLLAGVACEQAEAPFVSPVRFDTAAVTIQSDAATARLLVEVARTPEQRSFGLSLRRTLDPESGMIFLYDAAEGPTNAYWMWRTRVPLDIAFMDSAGAVVRVLAMEPCTAVYLDGCERYEPGVPYWSALEVNQGWFAEKGVGEGWW